MTKISYGEVVVDCRYQGLWFWYDPEEYRRIYRATVLGRYGVVV